MVPGIHHRDRHEQPDWYHMPSFCLRPDRVALYHMNDANVSFFFGAVQRSRARSSCGLANLAIWRRKYSSEQREQRRPCAARISPVRQLD